MWYVKIPVLGGGVVKSIFWWEWVVNILQSLLIHELSSLPFSNKLFTAFQYLWWPNNRNRWSNLQVGLPVWQPSLIFEHKTFFKLIYYAKLSTTLCVYCHHYFTFVLLGMHHEPTKGSWEILDSNKASFLVKRIYIFPNSHNVLTIILNYSHHNTEYSIKASVCTLVLKKSNADAVFTKKYITDRRNNYYKYWGWEGGFAQRKNPVGGRGRSGMKTNQIILVIRGGRLKNLPWGRKGKQISKPPISVGQLGIIVSGCLIPLITTYWILI